MVNPLGPLPAASLQVIDNDIATATASGKDVVFYKAGRTESGRSAAAGHTAAVAGDYDVCQAADQLLMQGLRPTIERVRLHIGWQIRNRHRPDIDDPAFRQPFKFRIHLSPHFRPLRELIAMVCTTVSGTDRRRSICSKPCSMLAPATSTPSASTKLR